MMAILKSCCFGTKSLRSGSFASGIYTLASYTMFVAIGAFHVNIVIHIPVLFILSVLLLIFSGFCVMASVILLVGLCVDNRKMLIPWMLAVSMTTGIDVLLCCFFINDKETVFDEIVWCLLFSDVSMCLLNIYCVMCVYSQYQEYMEGRGGPEGDQRLRDSQCHDFMITATPNFFYKQNEIKTNIYNRDQSKIEEKEEDYVNDEDRDTFSTSHSNNDVSCANESNGGLSGQNSVVSSSLAFVLTEQQHQNINKKLYCHKKVKFDNNNQIINGIMFPPKCFDLII